MRSAMPWAIVAFTLRSGDDETALGAWRRLATSWGRVVFAVCIGDDKAALRARPALHHRRPRLVAVDVEIEALLAERFFGLADR
jgi:hypothetical protein